MNDVIHLSLQQVSNAWQEYSMQLFCVFYNHSVFSITNVGKKVSYTCKSPLLFVPLLYKL